MDMVPAEAGMVFTSWSWTALWQSFHSLVWSFQAHNLQGRASDSQLHLWHLLPWFPYWTTPLNGRPVEPGELGDLTPVGFCLQVASVYLAQMASSRNISRQILRHGVMVMWLALRIGSNETTTCGCSLDQVEEQPVHFLRWCMALWAWLHSEIKFPPTLLNCSLCCSGRWAGFCQWAAWQSSCGWCPSGASGRATQENRIFLRHWTKSFPNTVNYIVESLL